MRPRSSMVARAAIVAAALVLAAGVARTGLAALLADSAPAAAARLAPGDARAAVATARAAIEHGAAADAPEVTALVAAALERDSTIPAAIELRAVALGAAGDARREAALFALSDTISRRSLPTRLWRIQRSVDRGDVAGALDDFDIALRTSTAAPELLFPVLAGATGDPGLAGPIARVLDRGQDWPAAFLHHAITEDGAAAGIAGVVLRMRDRRMIAAHGLDETLVGQLVAERRFVLARRVHGAFHPGGGGLVRDGSFADAGAGFPFGWKLTDEGEIGAERGGPGLAYRAAPGRGGPVATQLLTLGAGRYRLAVRTAAGARDGGAAPYWTITCGEVGGQIALLAQPASGGAGIDFVVPGGCGGQWLAFNLASSDAPEGQAGVVASVSVAGR